MPLLKRRTALALAELYQELKPWKIWRTMPKFGFLRALPAGKNSIPPGRICGMAVFTSPCP